MAALYLLEIVASGEMMGDMTENYSGSVITEEGVCFSLPDLNECLLLPQPLCDYTPLYITDHQPTCEMNQTASKGKGRMGQRVLPPYLVVHPVRLALVVFYTTTMVPQWSI